MHSRFKFKAEDFEQYFLDLMAGRRRNWYDRVLTDVLFIASRFYRMRSSSGSGCTTSA